MARESSLEKAEEEEVPRNKAPRVFWHLFQIAMKKTHIETTKA